jgi:nucleoside-diphosphate-sugar epimerase
VRRNVQDAGQIREAIGWAPQVSIDEGLAQVARAYRVELAPAGAAG